MSQHPVIGRGAGIEASVGLSPRWWVLFCEVVHRAIMEILAGSDSLAAGHVVTQIQRATRPK